MKGKKNFHCMRRYLWIRIQSQTPQPSDNCIYFLIDDRASIFVIWVKLIVLVLVSVMIAGW